MTWLWLALGGLALFVLLIRFVALPLAQRFIGKLARPGPPPPFGIPKPSANPWVWFDIGADNLLHLYCPKIEVGQGIHTLAAQLAAAELGLGLEAFRVHQPDSAKRKTGMINITGGSTSAMTIQTPLRQAAATLREMLNTVAAGQHNTSPEKIVLEVGQCVSDSGKISFFELLPALKNQLVPDVEPSPLASLELVGQELPRVDLPNCITGKTVFGADVRLPNMAYGAVARPPREGAELAHVTNAAKVKALPGVISVVVERGFAGVVAERRRQAWDAVKALNCTWRGGTRVSDDGLSERVKARAGKGAVIQSVGKSNYSAGAVTTEYRSHMFSPLPPEPPVSTVDAREDDATVYASTQSLHFVRNSAGKALGLPKDKVRVVITPVGSSFARKHGGAGDPTAAAARLSRAAGRPVQVMWTYQEDLAHGLKRPPGHMVMRAELAGGRIGSIETNLAMSDGSTVFPPQDMAPKLVGVDLSCVIGSQFLYSGIPNRHARYQHIPLPILTSFFRTPGISANTFALESFIDELAYQVDADPLDFRLQHLGNDEVNIRLKRVLETVRVDSNWDRSPDQNKARGVACYAYGNAVCATVTEVEQLGSDITISRIYVCAEAGKLINPNVSRSQVEGAVTQALSWAVYEKSELKNGLVQNTSLQTYNLIPPASTPKMQVRLLEDEVFRHGLNEIAGGLIAPSLGNALYALTGERHRQTPMRLSV